MDLIRCLIVLVWLWPAAAWSEAALVKDLLFVTEARVASVIDGDTIVLEDGREVRLVGIQAPKLPLGRGGFKAWPLADEARSALRDLVQDREVGLFTGGAARDRHGRILAHVLRTDDLWVQGEMLRRGLARVYSFPDNRAMIAPMLALEEGARQRQAGVWSHPFYAIRDKTTVARRVDNFEIVEDVVFSVETVRGVTFLNFEQDWRRDFTVKIDAKTARLFDRYSIALAELAGVRIRVRGWVKWENGPMIEVTHPEQLNVIPAEAEKGALL